jgi:hypothetical protein
MGRKQHSYPLLGLLLLIVSVAVHAKGAPDPALLALLREGGATSYSEKAPYGGGIEAMYLGYDASGAPVIGVATRQTKTYRESLAVVSVTVADGAFRIAAAVIPEIGQFHGKSQDYAREALRDIAGRILANEAAARGLVDTVTGATQYRQAIYVSCSLMAARIIREIQARPDWPKQALPAEAAGD